VCLWCGRTAAAHHAAGYRANATAKTQHVWLYGRQWTICILNAAFIVISQFSTAAHNLMRSVGCLACLALQVAGDGMCISRILAGGLDAFVIAAAFGASCLCCRLCPASLSGGLNPVVAWPLQHCALQWCAGFWSCYAICHDSDTSCRLYPCCSLMNSNHAQQPCFLLGEC